MEPPGLTPILSDHVTCPIDTAMEENAGWSDRVMKCFHPGAVGIHSTLHPLARTSPMTQSTRGTEEV